MGRKPKAEAEKKSDIVKDRVGEKTDLFLCVALDEAPKA